MKAKIVKNKQFNKTPLIVKPTSLPAKVEKFRYISKGNPQL